MVRRTDRLDMHISVDRDIKNQIKQTNSKEFTFPNSKSKYGTVVYWSSTFSDLSNKALLSKDIHDLAPFP